MTCPNNKSGKHCYEEDPFAHPRLGGGPPICCFCAVMESPKVKVKVEIDSVVQKVHEAAVARQTPIVHCAICHQKAPRVLVHDHILPGMIIRDGKVWQNDLNGWMVAEFPFTDRFLARREGMDAGTGWLEKAKLCPPCATKVRQYMAHLAKPMLDDGDL